MRPFRQIMKKVPIHLYKNSLNDFKPCKDYCLCLIYLNMNHQNDRIHYQHCYRTAQMNHKFNGQLK